METMWKSAKSESVLGSGMVLSQGNAEGAAIHTEPLSEEAANTGDGNTSLSSLLLHFCSAALF